MTKPFFKHLLLIFSLVLLTACAGGKTYESTGEYLDDVVIANKVRASIIGDSTLKFLQISVECYRGVVQLSGFVATPKSITRADASRVARAQATKSARAAHLISASNYGYVIHDLRLTGILAAIMLIGMIVLKLFVLR